MEFLVEKLANLITEPLHLDDEKRAVVKYGLFAIVQMILIAVIISLFGVLTGCLLECWVFYTAAGLLRKSTGGAHAKTSNGCLVVSVLAVSLFGIGARYFRALPHSIAIGTALCIVALAVACLLVYKLAPVDSPNKPLTSQKKIDRLRRQSGVTLLVYSALVVIFLLLSDRYFFTISLAVSLSLATLWQSLTLVKAANGG